MRPPRWERCRGCVAKAPVAIRTVPIHASTATDGIGPCCHQGVRSGGGGAVLRSVAWPGDDRPDHPERAGIAGNRGTNTRRRSSCRRRGRGVRRFDTGARPCASQWDGYDPVRRICRAAEAASASSAKIWESAGFKVALFDDIKQMVWEKLIMNVAFSGTSCTTGLTVSEILGDADAWSVARGCAEEAIAVAKAANVRLNVGDPIEHIRKLGGKIPDARPSMLLDYNAGRRCEVDAINGAISRLGRPLGVATPVNDTVGGIIKARARRMLAQQAAE